MLNKYFDKIYCINLDNAKDRWERCLEQFERYGVKVERFSGIMVDETHNHLLPGELGVMRSNYEIIKKSKDDNLGSVLILEDDFEFIDDFNVLFNKMINEVPDNWDFLYFGGNHLGPLNQISEHVYKMKHTYALHTFAIRNTMFDRILETLPREETQVDVYYANMMPNSNAYVFRPHLSSQRAGFSYIQNSYQDYKFLRD